MHKESKEFYSSVEELITKDIEGWFNTTDVKIEEISAPTEQSEKWMTFVVAGSEKIRIYYRVFYESADVSPVISKATLIDPDQLSMSSIKDFMGEFTNLVGGHLKSLLYENFDYLKISLPVTTRTGDREFFCIDRQNTSEKDVHHLKLWSLTVQGVKINCSLDLHVLDEESKLPDRLKLDDIFDNDPLAGLI